ncbi:MAG: hypothetical protein M0Z85_07520, partial [Gammaproteobacteria bacterium]|nr:hypothetical protein [Gammaproteobacteria bacterium]
GGPYDGYALVGAGEGGGHRRALPCRKLETLDFFSGGDYGWGITVHRSQGRTIDRSIVAGEASRVATSKAAYVSCSRERLALDIVTDDIGRLKKAWAATAERLTGHEAMRDDGRSAALEALRAEAQAEIKKESQEQEKARAKEQAPEAQPGPAPMRYQDFEMEM